MTTAIVGLSRSSATRSSSSDASSETCSRSATGFSSPTMARETGRPRSSPRSRRESLGSSSIESHTRLRPTSWSSRWCEDLRVFGVDGDEVYDPERLAELRRALLAGRFDNCWSISANAVHRVELMGYAKGELVTSQLAPSSARTLSA
jgi:hypothetical protein